jgi:glycosyltransferase involved in cell wall biosynthesis
VTLDHIDKILSILGLPFKRNFISGMLIYSRIYLKNNLINFIKKTLFLRLLNFFFIKNIFIVDQSFYAYCNNKIKNNKIIYTPDPGKIYYNFSKIESRQKYRLSKKDFIILVYGAIKNSKGIYELIEALNEIKINKIKVIIAGEQTNDIKLFLKNKISKYLIKNYRLIIDEGFKNYEEEARLFAAADVVWVAYNDNFNGSSAVLYQAGSVKKPVITSNKGLIGSINDKHKIGVSIDINDKKTIISKIVFMYKNNKVIKKLGLNNFLLSKNHSDKNFSKTICDKIFF